MPVTRNCARFKYRRSTFYLHQHHNGCRHRHRRRSVHHNAKRAMVGIGFQLVHVRHLRDGQERQQNQTHERRNRQSSKPCAALPAQKCSKSCQHTIPDIKNTQYWMD